MWMSPWKMEISWDILGYKPRPNYFGDMSHHHLDLGKNSHDTCLRHYNVDMQMTIVNGVYKPTYNWGPPHCRVMENHWLTLLTPPALWRVVCGVYSYKYGNTSISWDLLPLSWLLWLDLHQVAKVDWNCTPPSIPFSAREGLLSDNHQYTRIFPATVTTSTTGVLPNFVGSC